MTNDYTANNILDIWNFGDIMVLVWTPFPPPQPPHAKDCVSRNCDTNVRIKFIFDTAIDYLEWKNTMDLEIIEKPKWPPATILWKYDENCALHNLIKNAPINFIFDVATDLL